MAQKGQTFKRYSEKFKLKAVNMYLLGGMSYQAIAKELRIPSNTQVSSGSERRTVAKGLGISEGKINLMTPLLAYETKSTESLWSCPLLEPSPARTSTKQESPNGN